MSVYNISDVVFTGKWYAESGTMFLEIADFAYERPVKYRRRSHRRYWYTLWLIKHLEIVTIEDPEQTVMVFVDRQWVPEHKLVDIQRCSNE